MSEVEVKAPENFIVEEWGFFQPLEVPFESRRQVTKDTRTTIAIKEKLAADAGVPSTKIYVDTTRGEVLLFGNVANQAEKVAAETDAKAVSGVAVVNNDIYVKAMVSNDPIVGDKAIASEVKKILEKNKAFSKVEVNVDNGVVELTGQAPSSWERAHAGLVSRAAKGARSVDNEVQVAKN